MSRLLRLYPVVVCSCAVDGPGAAISGSPGRNGSGAVPRTAGFRIEPWMF